MAEKITVIKTIDKDDKPCYRVEGKTEGLEEIEDAMELEKATAAATAAPTTGEEPVTPAAPTTGEEPVTPAAPTTDEADSKTTGTEVAEEKIEGGGLFNFIRKTRPTMNKIQKSIKNLSNVLINKGDALRVGKGYNKTKCAYKNVLCSINDHHRCQKKTLKELFKNLKKQNHENRRRTNKRRN